MGGSVRGRDHAGAQWGEVIIRHLEAVWLQVDLGWREQITENIVEKNLKTPP